MVLFGSDSVLIDVEPEDVGHSPASSLPSLPVGTTPVQTTEIIEIVVVDNISTHSAHYQCANVHMITHVPSNARQQFQLSMTYPCSFVMNNAGYTITN